jgi:hypothetical protein
VLASPSWVSRRSPINTGCKWYIIRRTCRRDYILVMYGYLSKSLCLADSPTFSFLVVRDHHKLGLTICRSSLNRLTPVKATIWSKELTVRLNLDKVDRFGYALGMILST